jgi:hypothetical protein
MHLPLPRRALDSGIGDSRQVCYISPMAKTRKTRENILVPVVEEVPRISDAERAALRSSLDKARADIAAGDYDVVTPASLREEFDSVFGRGKTGKSATTPLRRPVPKRSRR